MKYTKPPLSYEAQADMLLQRGMRGDRALMIERLSSVNYYRLSGYWFPFRNPDDTFKAGTDFETVWRRYAFDRRLRLLVMDAIERMEVAIRSALAYHHAHNHGTFAYATDPKALPKFSVDQQAEFVARVQEETTRSKDQFVGHFFRKYGDEHSFLPVWMATEIMSFGTVLTLFRGSPRQVEQSVASVFGMPDVVFDSWLLTLNTVRNICAHHSRLWNRENGVKPIIPRIQDYQDWHTPVKIENNRVFAVLTICRHGLNCIAPQSSWSKRLHELLAEYPDIPRPNMGIPPTWLNCPIWARAEHVA